MTTKKRQVFYSFHYKKDASRASQVRNMGVVEGNKPVTDNDWEEVKGGGDSAIKNWIDNQMRYRSCTIVLVGEETASRKWIYYEIKESWKQGMGVVGIYIHGLRDFSTKTASKGKNPFDYIQATDTSSSNFRPIRLSSIVQCHLPEGGDSKRQYYWIATGLAKIVEAAIIKRDRYKHITIP